MKIMQYYFKTYESIQLQIVKKIGKYSKHSLFNAQKTNCIDNIYGHACDTTK